tara:strand:+ start:428 stop:799 length:372 start_codon:yes stop_codon:yes gene_type:complete
MLDYEKSAPADTNHSNDVASKGGNPHEGSSEDTEVSDGDAIHSAHAKACALVKLAEAGDLNEKFSEDWVKTKIDAANKNLTAIHDYIVNDKKAADSDEHGDDGGDGGDMGGGFIISIEKALSK